MAPLNHLRGVSIIWWNLAFRSLAIFIAEPRRISSSSHPIVLAVFFVDLYGYISSDPAGIIPNKSRWTYPPSILLDSGHSRNPAPAILDETCWNPKNPSTAGFRWPIHTYPHNYVLSPGGQECATHDNLVLRCLLLLGKCPWNSGLSWHFKVKF